MASPCGPLQLEIGIMAVAVTLLVNGSIRDTPPDTELSPGPLISGTVT